MSECREWLRHCRKDISMCELAARKSSNSHMRRSLCSSAARVFSMTNVSRFLTLMTIGNSGQTFSFSLTGVLGVKRSRRHRRRGDSKTMFRHFRHTCTSLCQHLFVLHRHRNRIFRGGQRQEACQWSPGLHRTSHCWQSVQAIGQKMYVPRSLLVDSLPDPECSCFADNDRSKWPSITMGDRGRQGNESNDGGAMAGYVEGNGNALDQGYLRVSQLYQQSDE